MNNETTTKTLNIQIALDGDLSTISKTVTVETPPPYTNSIVARVIRDDAGTIIGAITINNKLSTFGAPRGHYIRRAEAIWLA
jgi:hypothetical protein